jgi:hypothetical protein
VASNPLRIEQLLDALRQPLALVEGDERRRQIEIYVDAVRVPLERAAYDLLSQAIQAIDERVGDHYRVRLAYRPDGPAIEVEEKVGGEGDEARWSALEGDVEKITIRIPAELKDLATQAAASAGTSANAWFVKALARALRNMESQQRPQGWREERHERRHGSRLSGWVGGDED